MNKWLARPQVRLWLAIVGTVTLVMGTTYTLVQQSARLSADDLPLATAQTVKHELEGGAAPADVVPTIKTDLRTDSTIFVTITDANQHVLASNANLDGQSSLPPVGTFDFTKAHGTDRFSWEPTGGVRLATRMLTYGKDGNYIITGQSLSQAERRIDIYGWLTLAGWVAVLVWTYALMLLPRSSQKP